MSSKKLTQQEKVLLGERIKLLREREYLNQAEYAEKIGLSGRPTTISMYEKGLRVPDIDTLKKIATIGRTSLEWLIYGDKKNSPPIISDIDLTATKIVEKALKKTGVELSDEDKKNLIERVKKDYEKELEKEVKIIAFERGKKIG